MALVKPMKLLNNLKQIGILSVHNQIRNKTTSSTGGVLSEPKQVPFGLMRIFGAVIPGLLIGATISKNMANFLEENDLFVPSDDDDDDD